LVQGLALGGTDANITGALERIGWSLTALSKVEARQGVIGHNVRYVLWFGIAAMVALAAVYLFYF
jgi:hypothetical protein